MKDLKIGIAISEAAIAIAIGGLPTPGFGGQADKSADGFFNHGASPLTRRDTDFMLSIRTRTQSARTVLVLVLENEAEVPVLLTPVEWARLAGVPIFRPLLEFCFIFT